MRQIIIDFLSGFSKLMIRGLSEVLNHSGIYNSIDESMEKFRKKLFISGVAISLAATGFFLTLWGLASAIDSMFSMRGLGFILIGLLGMLTGALLYKK